MKGSQFSAVIAAVLLCGGIPASAQPYEPQLILAPTLANPEVDAFYTSRNDPAVWFKDQETRMAASALPKIFRDSVLDGFDGGPLADKVEEAIARGQPADDRVISAAWVRYVQALGAPVRGVSYGDKTLTPKRRSASEILAAVRRADSLPKHVHAVATVNPLYTAVRSAAIAEGRRSDPRVRGTLERLRLIPGEGRAILVDTASAHLWMLEDGQAVDDMKVIVGKTSSPTVLLAGTIHYITFNPYWNIPDDVARGRVAPIVAKRGISYLKAARYVTADGFGQQAQLIAPDSVDWDAVASGDAPVHLRQLPGAGNMMGAMKFGFVNDFDIFLHDTPKKQLFEKDQRALSMGCIRLEHADRLARWLLGRDPVPPSDAPEQHVQLDAGVPIYALSLTASVKDGQLAFAEDVYRLDGQPELAQGPEPGDR